MNFGIYVHLPFCPYVCPYCDFAKWPHRDSAAQRYLRALRCEIEAMAPRRATTLFLGGGTPNAYDAQTLAGLVESLSVRFGPAREVSVEVNPDLVRDGDLLAYRKAGVTRLSIGVQSFDDAEIRTLGRRHHAADVERAVRGARAAGIASVSLDLMFAIPGQTPRSWAQTLARAIALDADHVSTYGLQVEPGTPYAELREREPQRFFDDAAEAELYAMAIDALEAAGYRQYEISNFAREGHRCAHNENYWANGEYAGIGVGAASYLDGERFVHTRDLERYVEAALAQRPVPGESERLDELHRPGEAIMLALRTAQGVGLGAFKERYGIDVLARYASVVATFSSQGLLEHADGFIRLTRRGRFVANDVCAAFLETPQPV
jgi:oxygen-independent coproporphyrinogen-3 oxidase